MIFNPHWWEWLHSIYTKLTSHLSLLENKPTLSDFSTMLLLNSFLYTPISRLALLKGPLTEISFIKVNLKYTLSGLL